MVNELGSAYLRPNSITLSAPNLAPSRADRATKLPHRCLPTKQHPHRPSSTLSIPTLSFGLLNVYNAPVKTLLRISQQPEEAPFLCLGRAQPPLHFYSRLRDIRGLDGFSPQFMAQRLRSQRLSMWPIMKARRKKD